MYSVIIIHLNVRSSRNHCIASVKFLEQICFSIAFLCYLINYWYDYITSSYDLFTGVGWMLGASMLKRSRMLYVHFWNHQERNFKPHGKRVLESFTIIDPIINFPSNNFFSYGLYPLLMILTNGNALSLKKAIMSC